MADDQRRCDYCDGDDVDHVIEGEDGNRISLCDDCLRSIFVKVMAEQAAEQPTIN